MNKGHIKKQYGKWHRNKGSWDTKSELYANPNKVHIACESASFSDCNVPSIDEGTHVNEVPSFATNINFSENKGKPVRPFRNDHYQTIQPQAYRKFSTARVIKEVDTINGTYNV